MVNMIVLLPETVSRLEAHFRLLFSFSSKCKTMFLNGVTGWQ